MLASWPHWWCKRRQSRMDFCKTTTIWWRNWRLTHRRAFACTILVMLSSINTAQSYAITLRMLRRAFDVLNCVSVQGPVLQILSNWKSVVCQLEWHSVTQCMVSEWMLWVNDFKTRRCITKSVTSNKQTNMTSKLSACLREIHVNNYRVNSSCSSTTS